MSASPSAPASSGRNLWAVAIPAMVALAYASAHLAWYHGTPLGRGPVLDELENLVFAEQIADGSLPKEPFYRAPGYPLLLALLRIAGMARADLFLGALVLGVMCHAVNAALAAQLARKWFGQRAAWCAGLLVALHPVLVHYATQALDAVPAVMFFLAGLVCLQWHRHPHAEASRAWRRWLGASLLWAAAAMLRPNYFLLWCALPLLALGRSWRTERRLIAVAASLAGAMIFGCIATWQHRVSGVAGFLPWQGAYNLSAANEPGLHGRYYVQRHTLPAALGAINPARADSFYLFHRDTGAPPKDVAALNGYWRARFWRHVVEHPLWWAAHLARKTYALLNDWEQYNNKTFAFHQARSPWLRWNPIGWGIVFVLATAGAARLLAENSRDAAVLGVIAITCAASIVLFFVSARFRLPLAVIATALAGGALAAPGFWRRWSSRRQFALAALVIVAATITFSRFDGVRDRAPFAEDHALVARAASQQGDSAHAWRHASAALALKPHHPDALRVAVVSYFNLLVQGEAPVAQEPRWLEACTKLLTLPPRDIVELQAVAGVALWRTDQTTAALTAWRQLGAAPSALAARLLAGDPRVSARDLTAVGPEVWEQPLARLAGLKLGLTPPGGVRGGERGQAEMVIERVFGRATLRTSAP